MGRGFRKSLARMAARVVWVEDGGLLTLVLDSEITALRQVRHAVSDADIRAFPRACSTVVGFWSSADILRRSHRLLRFASIVPATKRSIWRTGCTSSSDRRPINVMTSFVSRKCEITEYSIKLRPVLRTWLVTPVFHKTSLSPRAIAATTESSRPRHAQHGDARSVHRPLA